MNKEAIGARTWQDTGLSEAVLKKKLGGQIIVGPVAKQALGLQAEISFKVGQEQARIEERKRTAEEIFAVVDKHRAWGSHVYDPDTASYSPRCWYNMLKASFDK